MAQRPKTYQNYVPPSTGKAYQITANADGTSKITDVTNYVTEGDSWGAEDANAVWDVLTGGASGNGALSVEDGGTGQTSIEGIRTALGINYPGPGAHNAIYRGISLGSAVTSAQWSAISAGTFDGLYIGDYWTIGGVTYRIAAFDYYYNTGDTATTKHHVTLVPDAPLYSAAMNSTNTTEGAYVGSEMYKTNLTQAKTTINSAFGEAHILNHRQYLQNAVTDGYASSGGWYDSTVELMTEQNVYGCKVFGDRLNTPIVPALHTLDNSQYPLFAFRHDMISNRQWFWLRDMADSNRFAASGETGRAGSDHAGLSIGVRPAFSIC